MVCATRGSIKGISWHTGSVLSAPRACPLFAANDNGDIDYRAIAAAANRLWRDFGPDASFTAATRAQSAFWQGRMATCRWWHSVARMLDRALIAGYCLQAQANGTCPRRRYVPANG